MCVNADETLFDNHFIDVHSIGPIERFVLNKIKEIDIVPFFKQYAPNCAVFIEKEPDGVQHLHALGCAFRIASLDTG